MATNKFGIVLISKNKSFMASFIRVFTDIANSTTIATIMAGGFESLDGFKSGIDQPDYDEIKNKAIHYLSGQKKSVEITLFLAQDQTDFEEQICNHKFADRPYLSMLFIDMDFIAGIRTFHSQIEEYFNELMMMLDKYSIKYSKKACSYVVFAPHPANGGDIAPGNPSYILRSLPLSNSQIQIEFLFHFMNFYDLYHLNFLDVPYADRTVPENALGKEIIKFLSCNNKSNWMFYYYTGSVVSAFINYIEFVNQQNGILCLRGPNEHSLACGALANWQLHHSAFLIVVTSGMMDEFKGTLSNLREARAKGFIICAENPQNAWFPFQGTMHQEENMLAILHAKEIPCVYIEDNHQLREKLLEAFQYYETQEGPVVILVTREVLEGANGLEEPLVYPAQNGLNNHTSLPAELSSNAEILEKVMEIINGSERKILWQCGILSELEEQLVYEIAEKAGIALADSIHHPGSVAKYRYGKINGNYLGTLSLYGYSKEIYSYLFTHGKLNDVDEQCIFFVKSKVSQISTPFSEGKLKRGLFLVQVTNNPDHVAPFIDIPVTMSLEDFLRYIQKNLHVNRNVLDFRKKEIEKCKSVTRSIVEQISTAPLYPNYFFTQLNCLIEEMIQNDHYEYTGIFDVGRCSISAIRNLARTGPGFSGWYGRALMGDALQSIQYVAMKSLTNILAFIGDGAKSIVPDILPSMVENLAANSMDLRKNITIFYLHNFTLSLIETFLHYKFFTDGARQTKVYSLIEQEYDRAFPGLTVSHHIIESFDRDLIKKSLSEPSKLNIFSVLLAHNNEGDSISLLNEGKWFS
jgi:hypothetical protein